MLYIPALVRYPSKYHDAAYLPISYLGPFTLAWAETAVTDATLTTVFLLILTGLTIWRALSLKQEALLCIGMGFGFILTLSHHLVPGSYVYVASVPTWAQSTVWFGAGLMTLLFIAYLAVLVCMAVRRIRRGVSHWPLIILHGLLLVWLGLAQFQLVLLHEYFGIALLIVSAISFVGSLVVEMKKVEDQFGQVLMNLCIIIATVGVFIQVEDEWASVAFLTYACLVLWLALRTQYTRTRIYGFIILTVALVRLVFEFKTVFDSISATIWTLIIGIAFTLLSFQYEQLKDMVSDALDKTNHKRHTSVP
jgi:hypothetical protein